MIELWVALALFIGDGGLAYVGASTGTALLLRQPPHCVIPVGTGKWECTPGARITELIRVTRPGEQALVCELLEIEGGAGEWSVYENRLFCRREIEARRKEQEASNGK